MSTRRNAARGAAANNSWACPKCKGPDGRALRLDGFMALCYKCGCEKIQTVSPTVRKIRPVGANATKSKEGNGGADGKTRAQRLATGKPSSPKDGQGQRNKELQAAQAKVAELEKALAAAKKKDDEGGEADAGDPETTTHEESAELKKVKKTLPAAATVIYIVLCQPRCSG